jgi:hypothetical protein
MDHLQNELGTVLNMGSKIVQTQLRKVGLPSDPLISKSFEGEADLRRDQPVPIQLHDQSLPSAALATQLSLVVGLP